MTPRAFLPTVSVLALSLFVGGCKKEQQASSVEAAPAPAPAETPDKPPPQEPVSVAQPASLPPPTLSPEEAKYAGYPPHVVHELKRLEKAYPNLETNIEEELKKLGSYERAVHKIQGDFDKLVRECVPLVSCSRGGARLFFQKDRLAHEATDKLMLLSMLGEQAGDVLSAMEKMDVEATDEELQKVYLRMRSIEQCEGRFIRLRNIYEWREKYLLPLYSQAVNKASDGGELTAIRTVARLLNLIAKKQGILNMTPEDENGVVGGRVASHRLARRDSFEERNDAMGWERPQAFGLRWSPEEDCRINLFQALRKRFQIDEVKLIDLAAVAALERDTARRLKLLELWHAALSVAGQMLEKWLPKDWETPKEEQWASLRNLVGSTVHYEPGNPYPKAEPWDHRLLIYTPNAGYTPGQFAVAIEENGKADLVRAALKKDADAPLGYSERWTLDELLLDDGKIRPMAKHGPRAAVASEPDAKATVGSRIQSARLLIEGDEKSQDPMLAAVLLMDPEVTDHPNANLIRERAQARLTPEQRRLVGRLEALLKEDAR